MGGGRASPRVRVRAAVGLVSAAMFVLVSGAGAVAGCSVLAGLVLASGLGSGLDGFGRN